MSIDFAVTILRGPRGGEEAVEVAKQGRRQRYNAARSLKTGSLERPDPADLAQPCPECRAEPGSPHASWCEFEEDEPEPDSGDWIKP